MWSCISSLLPRPSCCALSCKGLASFQLRKGGPAPTWCRITSASVLLLRVSCRSLLVLHCLPSHAIASSSTPFDGIERRPLLVPTKGLLRHPRGTVDATGVKQGDRGSIGEDHTAPYGLAYAFIYCRNYMPYRQARQWRGLRWATEQGHQPRWPSISIHHTSTHVYVEEAGLTPGSYLPPTCVE